MLGGHILHGGDYNPDQWLDCPEVLEEDIRLMKEANVPGHAWSRKKESTILTGLSRS